VIDYLLDTNVVSELVRPAPDARVVNWVRGIQEPHLFISVLTFGEIRRGIERLPGGTRRDRLQRWLDLDLTDRFEGRILGVDRDVAEVWGVIMGRAAARLPTLDMLIAATAAHHDMAVATRNTRDFARAGIDYVNPWD
jgi:predicted nucleic acid-binding protein